MSNLGRRPSEHRCAAAPDGGPEELLLRARKVWLGKTTEVARVLPDREVRMVGAWCFLDHYGPDHTSNTLVMPVGAHPHTGLQTVSRGRRPRRWTSWSTSGGPRHRDAASRGPWGPGARPGGRAVTEEIVMRWNFMGCSHQEVVAFRAEWEDRADRVPALVDRSEKVMQAAPTPTVALRPRPARRATP